MFEWFGNSNTKKFALDMATRLAKRYPPSVDQQQGKRPSVNRLTRIVEETCALAKEFQDEHKLSWFGRARLSNEFRWALSDLGYTKEFIDFATEAVVVYVSRRDTKAK